MHGIGNDYIYFNCLEQTIENPKALAVRLSDRHFGIGGDGIVLIEASTEADFKMRMFNADGSEAQMCGNAVRCVAKFVYDKGLTSKTTITLETLGGPQILHCSVVDNEVVTVRVDMGAPILDPQKIPLNTERTHSNRVTIDVADHSYDAVCVSMGNPHAVIFVPQITDSLVLDHGPIIEKHPLFPERVNVEFVEVLDRTTLRMRVWERGSGETLACGTGAAAVCVAAVLTEQSEREVVVKLLGGDLALEWNAESGHIFKTGSATTVFEGSVTL